MSTAKRLLIHLKAQHQNKCINLMLVIASVMFLLDLPLVVWFMTLCSYAFVGECQTKECEKVPQRDVALGLIKWKILNVTFAFKLNFSCLTNVLVSWIFRKHVQCVNKNDSFAFFFVIYYRVIYGNRRQRIRINILKSMDHEHWQL